MLVEQFVIFVLDVMETFPEICQGHVRIFVECLPDVVQRRVAVLSLWI
jgi:hypothetical protein